MIRTTIDPRAGLRRLFGGVQARGRGKILTPALSRSTRRGGDAELFLHAAFDRWAALALAWLAAFLPVNAPGQTPTPTTVSPPGPILPAVHARGQTRPVTAGSAGDPANLDVAWLSSPTEALAAAQKTKRPMLIVGVGAPDAASLAFDRVLQSKSVNTALQSWVCARVDVDESDDPIVQDMVRLPALRALSIEGRVIASHDGPLTQAEMTVFLQKALDDQVPGAIRANAESPDAAALHLWITALSSHDPLERETAIHRVEGHREIAADVADLLARGKLEARLSALEVLRRWQAPVDGLDPWHPQTLTAPRLSTLAKWASARTSATKPATEPAVSQDQLAAASAELERYLSAQGSAEILSSRERLARLGSALLPRVRALLKARGDAGEVGYRLRVLRYRLVSTDRDALEKPLIERLASTDPKVRADAANDLAQEASPDNAPLLLELFSHPDPLVREIALRGLHAIPDAQTSTALIALLHDPALNVRASVLKEFAERPALELVAPLRTYVATEKDTDLVVHTVRVLRAIKTRGSLDGLFDLADHPSWRVRAEVIDALAELIVNTELSDAQPRLMDLCKRKLNDPDPFVVGTALRPMIRNGNPVDLPEIIKAIKTHPTLTVEAIRKLADSEQLAAAAGDQLKEFCGNGDASIRAAGIAALCKALPDDCAAQLTSALADSASNVRIAAAEGLRGILDTRLPNSNGYIVDRTGRQREQVVPAEWLEAFHGGTGRPPWMDKTVSGLEKMLAGSDLTEALSAAAPLAALNRTAEVMPVLRRAAQANAQVRQSAADALPWLPWPQREELFKSMIAGMDAPARDPLITSFTRIQDYRAAAPLWKLLEKPDLDLEAARDLCEGLRASYFTGDEKSFAPRPLDATPESDPKTVVALWRAKAGAGGDAQRLVALALLAGGAPEEAVMAADALFADARTSPAIRIAAVQIRMRQSTRSEARTVALAALGDSQAGVRKMALALLAGNREVVGRLGDQIYLSYVNLELDGPDPSSTQSPDLRPPTGLTLAMLKPFSASNDDETVNYANYLRALLGDESRIGALYEFALKQDDWFWRERLYRAVAASGDDAMVHWVKLCYDALDKKRESSLVYGARQIYWTIHPLNGPQALALRKAIRDRVGMEQLR